MAITERTPTILETSSVTSGASFGGAASLPTGTAVGDYTVAQFAMQGTSIATPTGWTLLFTQQGIAASTEVLAVFGRLWSGTPAVPTTTSNGTGRATLILHTITDVDTSTPVDVAAHVTNSTGLGLSSWSDTGVTTVTDGALAMSFLIFDSSSRVPVVSGGAGYTLREGIDGTSGGRGAGLATLPVPTAGSSTAITWTVSPSAALSAAVATIAFRPKAGVSVTGTGSSTTTAAGDLTVVSGVSVTGTGSSTTTAAGTLNISATATGARANTTTASGALLLGAAVTGSGSSTTTASGDLTVQSNVFSAALEIELSPGSDVWTDFTSRIDMRSQALSIRYGRPTVYDDVGAGTLTCSLFDDDGQIMPDNPTAAYALEEGMRIRWRVSKGVDTWTRFRGWISNLVPEFPGASTIGTRVLVTAVDALGLLGQRKLRSNWTELALAAARAAGTTVDAYEAAGTALGWAATMTNYSTDTAASVGNYAYGVGSPNLSFTSDRDVSVGPVVSASPDSNGYTNTTIVGVQASRKCVEWLVKTPSSIPAAGVPWVISSLAVSISTNGINIACENNGSGDMRLIVSNAAGSASLGTLLNPAPHGQWVLIRVRENSTTASKCDVTATLLGDGTTTGTVSSISFDVKTVTFLEFPKKVGVTSSSALGGVIAFGSRSVTLAATEASILGAQGAVSARLADLQSALSQLPISWASSGTFDKTCVTGDWSDRTALEVLQELMRSNLMSVAFARPRDSTIYTIGYDQMRGSTASLLATFDTDRDCAGAPRLNRSVSTRPTRVQVDAPGLSSLTVDAALEAGPGNPQRLRTISTVCAATADLGAIGSVVLQQRTKLRIEQLTLDLTTAVTDHAPVLFDESGALTGLAPGVRVRAIVPTSHFGYPTRDYYVQGWTETYSPKAVTVMLDLDPTPTTTKLSETWTGSNGSAWSASKWGTTTGDAATGATVDVQSNRGRVVAGPSGNRVIKPALSSLPADVEITGTVQVTGAAEAQVYWRSDATFANGYALVFSASGGIRVQQVVASTLSTRYDAATVGGPAVVAGTDYSLRIRHIAQYLQIKVWATAGGEPLAWDLEAEDSLYTAAGYLGLGTWGASTTSTFDDFTVTDGV